jgi:hypothetical protein
MGFDLSDGVATDGFSGDVGRRRRSQGDDNRKYRKETHSEGRFVKKIKDICLSTEGLV